MGVVPIAHIADEKLRRPPLRCSVGVDPHVDVIRNSQASRYVPALPRSSASREAASRTNHPANSSVVLPDSVPAAACTYPKIGSGSTVVAIMGAGA